MSEWEPPVEQLRERIMKSFDVPKRTPNEDSLWDFGSFIPSSPLIAFMMHVYAINIFDQMYVNKSLTQNKLSLLCAMISRFPILRLSTQYLVECRNCAFMWQSREFFSSEHQQQQRDRQWINFSELSKTKPDTPTEKLKTPSVRCTHAAECTLNGKTLFTTGKT